MNEVYEGNDIKLVYASNYGELERVKKLLDQKNTEGEMSPTGFSFSVHNSSVGLFSLLNKINSPYSSISAGENSLSAGILESVITNDDVLFCFAESIGGLRGAACTFGRKPRVGAIKAELLPNGANATEPANASTLLITPHFFMEDCQIIISIFRIPALLNNFVQSCYSLFPIPVFPAFFCQVNIYLSKAFQNNHL